MPGVRIELTTFGLWDQRSTNWANPALMELKIFEARIELATSSVLDWRDNQLHHPNLMYMFELKMFEPRIELGTSRVWGARDNQLHHPNFATEANWRRGLAR